MGYINNQEKKCAICGNIHNFQSLGVNNSFGMRDLDTRPPGMMRNLMHLMIQKCPKCGYANYDISKIEYDICIEKLKSDEYQKILNSENINFALKKFILAGILLEDTKDKLTGMTYLRAAWIADDCKDKFIARKMRSKAIKFLERSLKEENNENIRLILVDLYRRIDMFEEASDYAKYLLNNLGMEKYKKNILLYQIKLCEEKDNMDHTIPGNYNLYAPTEDK